MNISRHLNPDLIKLSMDTAIETNPENEPPTDRQRRELKEQVLDELVGLLEKSGKISNRSKLLTEFINRERKASTAIGHGIAIPHVRTYQTRELIIGVARSTTGFDFDALDGEPVRLFFVMAAPSYDDTLYLKVFKALGEVLHFDYFRDQILETSEPHEFIRAFRSME